MKRCLILASVASMIDQFNMPNIELLQSMGYQVEVACNFKEGSTCSGEKIEGLKAKLEGLKVRFYQIDFARDVTNLGRNIKAIRQILNLAKKREYDFIHCHSPIGGVAGRLAGKLTGTKVIYTAHGFHFYKGAPLKNWFIYYPVEKICSYWTDVLITINHEDYGFAREKMKAKQVKYLSGVGIDLKKFDADTTLASEKRAELKIPDTAIVLLSVGELNENKNHELVIRAIAAIESKSETKARLEYIIVGKGERKKYLENLVMELEMNDHVHLLGYRDDVNDLFKAADVFVFPSFREGLSVSLMEAMASGLPCLVSDIRGNVDLIQDGMGGYLFNPKDSETLADLIEKVLSDKKKFAEMGKVNVKNIQSFSLESVVDDMRKIYLDVGKGVPV